MHPTPATLLCCHSLTFHRAVTPVRSHHPEPCSGQTATRTQRLGFQKQCRTAVSWGHLLICGLPHCTNVPLCEPRGCRGSA